MKSRFCVQDFAFEASTKYFALTPKDESTVAAVSCACGKTWLMTSSSFRVTWGAKSAEFNLPEAHPIGLARARGALFPRFACCWSLSLTLGLSPLSGAVGEYTLSPGSPMSLAG